MTGSIKIVAGFDTQFLKSFVENRVIPGAQERDQRGEFAIEIYEDLQRSGWLTAALPPEFGGKGMAVSDLIWVIRELAYGSAGVATTVMANLLGYSPVVLYGSKEIKRRVFKASDEPAFWCFAMTEEEVGFNIADTRTQAVEVEGGYLITGKKKYITNAQQAKHICVFANLVSEKHRPGVSAFYVPCQTQGVTQGPPMNKLGQRESDTGSLIFDGVFIPRENLLGEPGQGIHILHHCLGRTKTLIAAIASGMCQRAFDLATGHLSNRITGGKSLLEKPALQQFLARYETEFQAAWLLTCMAASTWDKGSLALKEASMAKMYSSNLAVQFINEALELIGARGYSQEHEISRMYRDVKLLEIYEGSTQILEILVAKELFAKKQKLPQPILKVA